MVVALALSATHCVAAILFESALVEFSGKTLATTFLLTFEASDERSWRFSWKCFLLSALELFCLVKSLLPPRPGIPLCGALEQLKEVFEWLSK